MKPDGVDTATMEPMEALNAGPAIEVAPVGEAQDQALPPTQPAEALSATNKTEKDKSADPKAKTKAAVKTKTPAAGTKASTTSSRPTTAQSRLTNGAQKSQTNGVTKKPTTGGLEKKTSTSAAPKKTAGSTTAPTTKTPTKAAEKKPLGTAKPAANGVKTTGAAQPIKKAPAAPANGLKSKPKTTAPASRPATASTTKTSTTGSAKPEKPSVAKTTKSVGSVPAARSSPAAPKPATPSTASKTSTSTSRPTTATPKTPSTTAKPSPAKTTAPPAGRTLTPKTTTTPVKKDVSKPSTPAAKKPTASPLTRPASAKTAKPETPKSASTAKAEPASKKPTTSSKAADVKTSKPKESKATPSKEVSASPKTPGSKPSTKTSSPKKSVGSTTPMSLKGGPKASQPAATTATEAEKKDVVPAVVAATAAAAAVLSVVTSEGAPEESVTTVAPAAIEEAPEDLLIPINPADSEVKLEDSLTTVIHASSEDFKEDFKDMATPVIAPPTLEAPEDEVTTVIPSFSEERHEDRTTSEVPLSSDEAREETVSPVNHHAIEETPEDTPTSVIPPTSYETRDESVSPVIPPASEDTFTPFVPPMSYEEREETVSPVIPPASEDTTTSANPHMSYEAREETVSPVIPPAFEDTTTSVISPSCFETREETVSPVIPPAYEETDEDTTVSFIPPTSYEAKEETVSPVIPPASEETPEDVTTSVIPPTSFEARGESVSPAFDEDPDDTVTPVISPTTEMEPVYPQDSHQSIDTYKDDYVMSQFAAEVNQVSQEEPAPAVSPLGTTVLSPPSSPTGPSSMPVELPSSAPFLGLQGPAEPWGLSSSLYPSSGTVESQEQDEESEKDDEQEQEDIQMPSASENVMGHFDLLGSTSVGHIKSEAPASHWQEREEAVEKAEEEINEDNDEEEEEEEDDDEEDEVREIGIKESEPPKEKEDDFKKVVSDSASSDWGIMESDEQMFSSNKHESEVTSPFNAADSCSAKETGDFMMNEADEEQPFKGPPGIQSFGSEDEEEDDEEEHLQKDVDLGLQHDNEYYKQQKEEEEEEEDEDMEMVHKGMAESELRVSGNDDNEDEHTEEHHIDLNSMGHTAQATSMPQTTACSFSNPFSDHWTQPASILPESSLSDSRYQDPDTTTRFSADLDAPITYSADPDTPPKSPANAFLEMSPFLIQASEPQPDTQEETGCSAPAEPGILAPSAIGMSQSSTLSGTALAAHSSSETSTPEELRDYDSSSGVESRSDKQQTPVPAMQTDMEQDLGIHLERGDGEEEEAETLPADEVLGDAATAPASVPSSPSTSGDEASDTEGEMQINDPDVAVDDQTAVPHNLASLEEDEEAPEQIGEEDGDTPQSANSVASYGFDCSASISNAHSMAESCGKSPGIFSLENEEQLPEEAKDPSFIKELTLPAATAYSDDLLGCPVDLLPISEPTERDAGFDEHYMMCSKTDPGTLEEMDPESPMHLSPQHGDDSDGQPPYYSAICDKTDNFLAGPPRIDMPPDVHHFSRSPQMNANHLRFAKEVNDNNYLAPLPNAPSAPPPPLVPNIQLRRLEQHQLQLRHIRQRQQQERRERLCLEEERERQQQQRALERQRRELLQLQLQQQQQEQRLRRQLLQRQLEAEQQQRLKPQGRGNPPLPSTGLCTIYEAMETSEEEEDTESSSTANESSQNNSIPTDVPLRVANGNLRRPPPQELDWNTKMDMVQQLLNQALLLAGEDNCPPLLYLPGQGGGVLSPLESSLWPHIMAHLNCSADSVASVSSFSPSSQPSSMKGDWTVVELETHH